MYGIDLRGSAYAGFTSTFSFYVYAFLGPSSLGGLIAYYCQKRILHRLSGQKSAARGDADVQVMSVMPPKKLVFVWEVGSGERSASIDDPPLAVA
jgi:hypothetical protein